MSASNLDAEAVERLVRAQIQNASTSQRSSLMKTLLVPPRCELRPWSYGGPGMMLPCWIVAEHRSSNTAIAYCEQGFGPRAPWGLLAMEGPHMNIGQDSGWFTSFEEAMMDSYAVSEPKSE
jgi:hypothetical protein